MDNVSKNETECGLPLSVKRKPILCVDFDGVIHAYTTRWINEWSISDEPVPGALQWLYEATNHFDVQIYSSRSKVIEGRHAMKRWMVYHSTAIWGVLHPMSKSSGDYPIGFAADKPPAFLTIDDRGWRFEGDWSAMPSPGELLQFKPWNRR